MVEFIVTLSIIVITLTFLFCVAGMLYRVAAINCCREEVYAECIGVFSVRSVRFNGSIFRVKFKYYYNGIEYVSNTLDFYNKRYILGKYSVGKTYNVFIDSNSPNHVCINNRLMLSDFVTILLMLLLVVLGVVVCLKNMI